MKRTNFVPTFASSPLSDTFENFLGINDIFDSLFNPSSIPQNSYPPCNIISIDDENWKLEFAVAGFSIDDLSVTLNHKNILSIEGKKEKTTMEEPASQKFIHRGISQRSFKTSFHITSGTEVKDVVLDGGLLTVNLFKAKPEEAKPQNLKITYKK